MIATHKMLATVQPVEYSLEVIDIAKPKVTKTIDLIMRLHPSIPVLDHDFVHVRRIGEWTVAILDDIGVKKMII
jgi:hypothetical protein